MTLVFRLEPIVEKLSKMFPEFDRETLESVFVAQGHSMDRAINSLLILSGQKSNAKINSELDESSNGDQTYPDSISPALVISSRILDPFTIRQLLEFISLPFKFKLLFTFRGLLFLNGMVRVFCAGVTAICTSLFIHHHRNSCKYILTAEEMQFNALKYFESAGVSPFFLSKAHGSQKHEEKERKETEKWETLIDVGELFSYLRFHLNQEGKKRGVVSILDYSAARLLGHWINALVTFFYSRIKEMKLHNPNCWSSSHLTVDEKNIVSAILNTPHFSETWKLLLPLVQRMHSSSFHREYDLVDDILLFAQQHHQVTISTFIPELIQGEGGTKSTQTKKKRTEPFDVPTEKAERERLFLYAVSQGDRKTVTRLLRDHGFDVNLQEGDTGCTALMIACINNDCQMIKTLIRWKANVLIADQAGNTPLFHAAEYGNIDAFRLLLQRKSQLRSRILKTNTSGATVLDVALDSGGNAVCGVVRELLELASSQTIRKWVSSHREELVVSAASCGDNELLSRLLRGFIPPSDQEKGEEKSKELTSGVTVRSWSKGLGAALVDALNVACKAGHAKIVGLLLQTGVPVIHNGKSALINAVLGMNYRVVELLLPYCMHWDIDVVIDGETALRLAAGLQDRESVILLVDAGASVVSSRGDSLLRAVEIGDYEIVHLLLLGYGNAPLYLPGECDSEHLAYLLAVASAMHPKAPFLNLLRSVQVPRFDPEAERPPIWKDFFTLVEWAQYRVAESIDTIRGARLVEKLGVVGIGELLLYRARCCFRRFDTPGLRSCEWQTLKTFYLAHSLRFSEPSHEQC